MKSFTTMLIALIAVAFLLTSCKQPLQQQNAPPTNPIIFITSGDSITGQLTLDPPATDTIFVSRSNSIIWIVLPNSVVKSIDSIPPKAGSNDVFMQGNPYQDNSYGPSVPVWRGKINPSHNAPDLEDYSIFWKDINGKTHEFDPTIKVEPNEN